MSNLKQEIMSNSLRNRVSLIGNLGQDPQIRDLENGRKVVNFTIATNQGFRNAEGQKVQETTWHNIVAWNGLAETAAKYLRKGREVALEGRIAYRTYEDKQGVTKYITEIVLSDILFLQSSKGISEEE